jgi:hypothetical protein
LGRYVCKTCGIEKDESEYRVKQKVLLKTGLKSYRNCHCNICQDKRNLVYREKEPYSWIANRYKVSKEEAKYWYGRSMTSCEICGHQWKEGKERLCIDHDHSTGKVRGILCKHCNHVLGHSRESLQILDNAKAYLMSHREEN